MARKVPDFNDEPSGSPHKGEPDYLVVGKLRRPHGISGEILFEMTSESPELFEPGNHVLIGENKTPYTIYTIRQSNKYWLISLEGFKDRDQVDVLRNQLVYVKTVDLPPLPDDRFYHHEVIGMQVVDARNQPLGEVYEILVTGANDVYVVKTSEGSELLIPAVKSVILNIDRGSRTIMVRPQEWI